MSAERKSFRYHVVDAFTSQPFRGNPAAVVVLQDGMNFSTETMQLIAREFNLSETAFVTPRAKELDAKATSARFGLRWFTPAVEVPLCGHATLASSKVLFSSDIEGIVGESVRTLEFETLSGILKAQKLDDGRLELVFPAGETEPLLADLKESIDKVIKTFLGSEVPVVAVQQGIESIKEWLLIEIDNSIDLEKLEVKPDVLTQLKPLSLTSIAVTSKSAPNANTSFVSRAFAPLYGIPEDPVTGSMHCVVGPYWAKKLGVEYGKGMLARQVSTRGGDIEVVCDEVENGTEDGDKKLEKKKRCYLRGEARIMASGEMYI